MTRFNSKGAVRPAPNVSIVVPVAPGLSPASVLRGLRASHCTGHGIEILTVTGRHPSRQRNLAAQRARGDLLYFLDHDSAVAPRALQVLRRTFADPRVGAAGGPNPGIPGGSLFAWAVDKVLGSPFGSLTVLRRYRPTGRCARPVGEESLILCNLMVRRDVFLDLGGFDPRLYPNEENEFINRMKARGWLAMYVPEAQAAKPRPEGLAAYLRENFRYARGRMEQIWVDFHASDTPYLAVVAALAGLALSRPTLPWIAFLAALYVTAAAIQGIFLAAGRIVESRPGPGAASRAAAIAVLIILRHGAYALGLLWGVASGWRKRRVAGPAQFFGLTVSVWRSGRLVPGRQVTLRTGPLAVRA